MKHQKLQVFLPLLISISMALGMFIGFSMKDHFADYGFFDHKRSSTLEEVVKLIQNHYVDDVTTDKFQDSTIQSLLSALDPHSAYLPARELKDLNNDINGNFCGIGIEYDIFNDTLFVTNVHRNGPAYESGLIIGDQIISIDGKSLNHQGFNYDSIHVYFSGDCGAVSQFGILRNGLKKSVDIKRDLIPDISVRGGLLPDDSTGYLKIERFSSQTHREFMEKITALNNKGMKQLILDLRGNGGGVLGEAIEIADEFLDGDKLISYTEGKHSPRKEYRCRRLGQFETGKLIVLSDEESASASEVLMGALQDWDRALIIGKRSFGKGLVQEIYDLSNNSGLKLTVSRYYTPLGRCIQRSYANGVADYYDEILQRRMDVDQNNTDKGKAFLTPRKKKLFSGNGIAPDVSITDSNNIIPDSVSSLFSGGLLYRFCQQTIPVKLKNFDTSKLDWNDFYLTTQLTENDWTTLMRFSKKPASEFRDLLSRYQPTITRWIKIYMIRNIWDDDAMYLAMQQDDAVTHRAETMLQNQ